MHRSELFHHWSLFLIFGAILCDWFSLHVTGGNVLTAMFYSIIHARKSFVCPGQRIYLSQRIPLSLICTAFSLYIIRVYNTKWWLSVWVILVTTPLLIGTAIAHQHTHVCLVICCCFTP